MDRTLDLAVPNMEARDVLFQDAQFLSSDLMPQPTQNRKIVLYVLTCWGLAWLWLGSFRLGLRTGEAIALLVLMWIPGLSATVFRLAYREGFRDIGLSLGAPRYWLWAFVAPLALASVVVAVAVFFGRVTLDPALSKQTMLDALVFELRWPFPEAAPGFLLVQRSLAVALVMTFVGFPFALGEELGWRGYLLPRMVEADWPAPLLSSGIVWGIWHFPLFFLTGYGHGHVVISLIMFTTLTALFGIFVGWLRLASGSILVATIAHSSFNGFVQSLFVPSFTGDSAWFWIGDYGALTLVSYACIAVWLRQSGRLRPISEGRP